MLNIFESHAQVPNISYPVKDHIYVLGGLIAPLLPSNSGGAVPALEYGSVSTFAGSGKSGRLDGAASTAQFDRPTGIAVESNGNVYVADSFNNMIRRVTPDGIVTTVAGSGVAGRLNGQGSNAQFRQPFGLVVAPDGTLYIADSGNNQIRQIDQSGNVTLFAGDPGGRDNYVNGPLSVSRFKLPEGIVFDAVGNMYIADTENFSIRMIDLSGMVSNFAGTGGVPGEVDGQGNTAKFDRPVALQRDPQGNFFVADYINNRIRKISPTGLVSTYAGTGARTSVDGPASMASFDQPTGLAVDQLGNVYVSDNKNLIRRISVLTGLVSTIAGSGLAGAQDGMRWDATFEHPIGLGFDRLGNLFVADEHNNKIRRILLEGGYSIDKRLPEGLTFDPRTGAINGTPTVSWPKTIYTVTAHNGFGESSAEITIKVTDPLISFPVLTDKFPCDPDFDPGATAEVSLTYSSSEPTVATIIGQKIHITGVGTTLITASDGASTATQSLTVLEYTKPAVSLSPVNYIACEGETMTFSVEHSNAGTNPLFEWYVNGVLELTGTENFSRADLKTNDAVSCVAINNDYCLPIRSELSNTARVERTPRASLQLEIQTSTTWPVCPNIPVTFNARILGQAAPSLPPVYEWLVNGVVVSTGNAELTISTLSDGDLISSRINMAGACVVEPLILSNKIKINVADRSTCDLKIPSAFSPNGDGKNDDWNIPALAAYPSCSVTVFNRNGQMVFHSTGYSIPWDGSHQGKPLPVGIYYFVIQPAMQLPKRSGLVALLK